MKFTHSTSLTALEGYRSARLVYKEGPVESWLPDIANAPEKTMQVMKPRLQEISAGVTYGVSTVAETAINDTVNLVSQAVRVATTPVDMTIKAATRTIDGSIEAGKELLDAAQSVVATPIDAMGQSLSKAKTDFQEGKWFSAVAGATIGTSVAGVHGGLLGGWNLLKKTLYNTTVRPIGGTLRIGYEGTSRAVGGTLGFTTSLIKAPFRLVRGVFSGLAMSIRGAGRGIRDGAKVGFENTVVPRYSVTPEPNIVGKTDDPSGGDFLSKSVYKK